MGNGEVVMSTHVQSSPWAYIFVSLRKMGERRIAGSNRKCTLGSLNSDETVSQTDGMMAPSY